MDDRERIGVLTDILDECPVVCDFYGLEMETERIAEYLVDNGVVAQRWIPVSEMLPNRELKDAKKQGMDVYPCLAVIRSPRAKGGKYVGKAWYTGMRCFVERDWTDITFDVTHWMPLPELPKEDE